MPAHTVKAATVYANYTTKKNLTDSDSVAVVRGGRAREVKETRKRRVYLQSTWIRNPNIAVTYFLAVSLA